MANIINVRSERQAQDWSVVLLSQGIESVIQPGAEPEQWMLIVDPADYTRALRTLRTYIAENKRPLWVQSVPWSGGLVFDGRSAVWFLMLAVLFYLSTHRFEAIRMAGIVDSTRIQEGEWWRFFTAIMLHGDVPHLVSNCTIGIIFLGLAMAYYGAGLALLSTFLSGAAANVVSFLVYQHPYRALGASGMVMAALGMLAVHSVWLWRSQRAGPVVLRSLLGAILLLVLVGFDPASDVVAHVSGFVAGGICGVILRNRWAREERVNTLAGLACGALAGLCWWLALR